MSDSIIDAKQAADSSSFALNVDARTSIISWALYPALMLFAFALYLGFLHTETHQLISNYLPIVIACVFLTFYEWKTPHKKAWHPGLSDIGNDSLYTVVVQIMLPELLTLGLFLWLLTMTAGQIMIVDFWPHSWSLIEQTCLMIVIADFFRYWWHRLSHFSSFLWKYHEVHHSVDKLYWLNSGRFHPVEKLVHYTHDALPFLLLGVSPEVMGAYFVIFAVNAYFLHSNIRLNYGWIKYIMNSADAHRWHHARNPKDSNHNYGNILIIWDIMFSSFFIPKNRELKQIGLTNSEYPTGFWQQITAPFKKSR